MAKTTTKATPAKTTTKKEKLSTKELLAIAEKELIAKYPKQKIKPGSLRAAGEIEAFGNKRTIIIYCQATNAERRIATSDLHQVYYAKGVNPNKGDKPAKKTTKAGSTSGTSTKKTAPKPTAKAKIKTATPKNDTKENKPATKHQSNGQTQAKATAAVQDEADILDPLE